jgi:hypothetical protein
MRTGLKLAGSRICWLTWAPGGLQDASWHDDGEVVIVPPTKFFPASEDRLINTGEQQALRDARPLPRGSGQTSFNTASVSGVFATTTSFPANIKKFHLANTT